LKPTKQHIADKALQLFNDKGFVNVRLQHIADAAFVSIGHLAYHFKNKDAILEFLYEAIKTAKEDMLNEHKVVPLFEDINRMLEQIFHHQLKYSFFYTDILEITRAYPLLAEKYKQHIQWQRMQLSLLIQFNMSRGAMLLSKNDLEGVSKQWQWMIDNWLHNLLVDGGRAAELPHFLHDCWLFLRAYFTDTGLNEYRQGAFY
jgi:AcrR family transcriptional regulator